MYRRSYNSSSYSSPYYSRRTNDGTSYRPYSSYNDRYSSSSFSPLYRFYGYDRAEDYSYPWRRDDYYRRRRVERERREEGERDPEDNNREESRRDTELRDPEKDEEVNKEFHVLKVNMNQEQNADEHHTDQYECVFRKKNPELVVRRGQAFTVTINFDRDYNKEKNEIIFKFTTGPKPLPSQGTSVKFRMSEEMNSKGDGKEWFAKLVKEETKCIDVEITPPCKCIIGEWQFSIHTESKLKKDDIPLIFVYKHNEDINILLNPWCKDDPVYMSTTKLLDEYILNPSGAIWSGNSRQPSVKPWNFGQFEDGILGICLHLVRKAFGNEMSTLMADPIRLARAVSRIVNAPDNNGVLVGNWSGDYSGGTAPTKWTSSVSILKEYENNEGAPVKYGQCWVFSAVTTTVCRAIGLPARSVTNFASAHDTHFNTCIDRFVDKDGNKMDANDSIWNFHVWNDVWMARPDLTRGYDGWQAIDATPQETSEGIYQCGPAPLRAIKQGEIGTVNYDAPFIFAEVNADVVTWQVLENDEMKIIQTDPNHVGRKISTKNPDGRAYNGEASVWWGYGEKFRLDVTSEYKFPEGTIEERVAVQNACNAVESAHKDVFKVYGKQDVFVKITGQDDLLIGNDFKLDIQFKNKANKRDSRDDRKRTLTNMQVKVNAVKYTGDGRRNIITKQLKDSSLGFQEEQTETITVTKEDYWDKLYDFFEMQVEVYVHVKESENSHLEVYEYRLKRPDLKLEVPDKVEIGVPFDIKLSFTNPLHVPMTECALDVEGNGIKGLHVKDIGNIAPGSEWKSVQSLTVTGRPKEIQINASFDCKELRDIAGVTIIKNVVSR